jgi:Mn-dependent DtxR family transcriptional regulator
MLLSNLKNSNYIDKKAYSTDRTLTLTAKGEKKAIEVLKSLIG